MRAETLHLSFQMSSNPLRHLQSRRTLFKNWSGSCDADFQEAFEPKMRLERRASKLFSAPLRIDIDLRQSHLPLETHFAFGRSGTFVEEIQTLVGKLLP